MSVFKKLASDTAIYGISTMLGRFLNYLLVALHTYLFDPEEIAAQGQLYAYAGIGLVIYTFGMETSFFRFARHEKDRTQYYNLILSAVMITSVALSGFLFAFASQVADLILYPESASVVRMFAFIMAIDAIVAIPFARLRLEGKGRKFVTIKVVNILISIFLNLFFLVFCRDVYAGHYLGVLRPAVELIYNPENAPDYIIVANLIANLLFFAMLRKELLDFKFVFNRQLFKPVWVYAFPILVMNAGGVLNVLFDRAFIQYLLPEGFYPGRSNKQAIGIYIQCYKLSMFMNLAIQSFKYAAEPFFFTKGEDKNAPEVFAKVTRWFVIICVVMWVAISLNVDLLAELFLKKKIFHEGIAVVPWLLAGFLFLGVYYNIATWFKLTDKTQYGTFLTLSGVSVVALLNFLLVPQFGYLGCAMAFACSGFVMMVLCYYFGQKFYPVPYDVKSALTYMIVGSVLIGLAWMYRIPDLTVSVLVHTLVIAVFVGAILLVERHSIPFGFKKK
jgi:O-antigen/teichoic acid export membrane protein